MNIYIAGPFSKPEEKEILKHMIDIVKMKYQDVNFYIPMEFTVPGDYQKPDGTWNLPNEEWARKVYESDLKHLNEADVVFALYIGHYCSSGTVWEIGYANGKNIPVIAYIPEKAKGDNMSLMVLNSFSGFIEESGEIKDFTVEELKKFNQK